MGVQYKQKLLKEALELVESEEAAYHIRSALQHIQYDEHYSNS